MNQVITNIATLFLEKTKVIDRYFRIYRDVKSYECFL